MNASPVEKTLRELEQLPIGAPGGTRPITPCEHGVIDYMQGAMLIAAPTLFGLSGSTAAASRTFGVIMLASNALTDHPVAVSRVIPFRAHGTLEKFLGPAFGLFGLLAGGFRRSRNLNFLLGQTILAATIFNLTDWNGNPDR